MVMHESPFPYQGPLAPEQVRGREELIADLTARLAGHRVTALLGPRRYGKTSALRRVLADLHGVSTDAVWIDLYELTSLEDLAARIDAGLDAVRGPLRQALDRVASALQVSLGTVSVTLHGKASARPDPAVTIGALLRTLVGAAQARPLVVAFDEFSGIAPVEGAAGLLRTGLQHHYQRIGIVFAGSEPSLMRALFTDHAQPFYGQADLVEIGPLAPADVVAIVQDGFAATDRDPGPAPARIVRSARGHPQRSMQLADAVWGHTPVGRAVTDLIWADALEDTRNAVAGGLERMYSSLPAGHQKVLRALASGGSIFGTAARILDLAPGAAQHGRQALADLGHLHQDDGWVVTDPLFADWLRRRFPI